jgi:hypothetical protein
MGYGTEFIAAYKIGKITTGLSATKFDGWKVLAKCSKITRATLA